MSLVALIIYVFLFELPSSTCLFQLSSSVCVVAHPFTSKVVLKTRYMTVKITYFRNETTSIDSNRLQICHCFPVHNQKAPQMAAIMT